METKELTGEKTVRARPKLNESPLHALGALTKRDLRKWYTNPIQFVTSLIQPIVWLALFGKALNFGAIISSTVAIPQAQQDAIMKSIFGTPNYFSFLACGMIAFVVLFTSAISGMSVVSDRRFGFLNKALTTPVARGTIVMSKILQSVGRSMVQATIVLVIAIVLGMDTTNFSIFGLLGTFAVIFLMGMGLSALFAMFALRSSDWQTQIAIINLINLPLLFASNAMLPAKLMPNWLQTIVNLNPISYANDAVRQLLLGAPGMVSLWVDFVILTGFALVLSVIGIVLSWKFLSK